jgi:putative pyruvate formate lyase activating enzyme
MGVWGYRCGMTATDSANPTSCSLDWGADGLRERLGCASQMLRACNMCEHRCGCDRTVGRIGRCGLGEATGVFREEISLGDDPEWLPSLRVYVGGCNLRCRFCITAPDGYETQPGQIIGVAEAARRFRQAIDDGVRSINLYGGEPTLHAHTLLEIAAAAGRRLPFVLNTNGYASAATIELLQDIVSAWVVDFKFGNDECAESVAGVSRYTSVLTRNLLHLASGAFLGGGQSCPPMAIQSVPAEEAGRDARPRILQVRHLLLPGHLNCCLRPIVEWLSANLPGARFILNTGYVPHYRAGEDPLLGRLNTRAEIRDAGRLVTESALDGRVD